MLDSLPDDYSDAEHWFRYFRMTKFLQAIPAKFEREFPKVPDAEAARTVMTAYAATALDIIIYGGYSEPNNWADELQTVFNLKPSDFLQLKTDDIANLVRLDAETLSARLTSAGFEIANGRITQFTAATSGMKPKSGPKP